MAYLEQAPDFSGFATALDYVAAGPRRDRDLSRPRACSTRRCSTAAAEPAKILRRRGAPRGDRASALAGEPELLLLDEPTNHLDIVAIEWLERRLLDSRAAFVLISHDRRLLTNLTTSTVWLDRGLTRQLDRGFSAFEAWRDEVLASQRNWSATSSAARSRTKSIGCATASPRGASATCAASANSRTCARS